MKKILRAMLAISLCFAIVFSATMISSSASSIIKSSVDGRVPVTKTEYYYRDSYFSIDASEYLPSLSTMSFWLAASGAASGSGENQSKNARTLLTEIGFSDFEVNDDFKTTPGTDTMGVAVAHKEIELNGEKSTLIAVVPRSMNYDNEWASNFTIGSTGEAQGFSNSAKKVEAFVGEYTEKYKSKFSDNIKAWIVGYSRGAAVANLVAGHFSQSGKVGTLTADKEDIYGYTFETPMGAHSSSISYAKAKSYTNIHNIISTNDLVTKLAPSNWTFFRYGTDELVVPTVRNSSNTKIFDSAAEFLPKYLSAYTTDGKKIFASETFKTRKFNGDFSALSKLGSWQNVDGTYVWNGVDAETAISMITEPSDKTMDEFWDDVLNDLTIGVGNRANYENKLQEPLRLILSEFTGDKYSSETLDTAIGILGQQLEEKGMSLVMAAVSLNKTYLTSVVEDILNEVVSGAGLDSTVYGNLSAQIVDLIPIVVNTALADVALFGGAEIFGIIDNFDIIFNPHYPDQCSSFLMASDVNYNPSIDASKVSGVDVKITTTKTTKKVLFVKTTVTTNNVAISAISELPVQNIQYRTSKLSSWRTGTDYSTNLSVGRIYIRVTDADGRITEWEYYNGTAKKTK